MSFNIYSGLGNDCIGFRCQLAPFTGHKQLRRLLAGPTEPPWLFAGDNVAGSRVCVAAVDLAALSACVGVFLARPSEKGLEPSSRQRRDSVPQKVGRMLRINPPRHPRITMPENTRDLLDGDAGLYHHVAAVCLRTCGVTPASPARRAAARVPVFTLATGHPPCSMTNSQVAACRAAVRNGRSRSAIGTTARPLPAVTCPRSINPLVRSTRSHVSPRTAPARPAV